MNSIFDIPPKKVMEATGRPRSTVYRWYAVRRIPIEELDRIEKIFGFKREDVRPDLPWRIENMKPYQEQVIAEKDEIDKKLDELRAFVQQKEFLELSNEEKNYINMQFEYMSMYSAVLGQRIAIFNR